MSGDEEVASQESRVESSPTRRVALLLQYVGTRYAGWQAQENGRAVQSVVEEALGILTKSPGRVVIQGSSRTDAGVHALMQVATADLPAALPAVGVVFGLNNLLPADIRVAAALEVPPQWRVLDEIRAKEYVYRFWASGEIRPPHLAETTTAAIRSIDWARFEDAVAVLPGIRDFVRFRKSGSDSRTTVREVQSASLEWSADRRIALFRISGSGFLRGTVRILAGSLVDVGRNRLSVDALRELLDPERGTSSSARPGECLPASGLTLRRVVASGVPLPEPPLPEGLW